MLGAKYGKNILILAVISVISAATLIYLFLSDFSEFNMPNVIVHSFYFYTSLLLVYTVLVVLIMRHYDHRFPVKNSLLWKYAKIMLGALWLIDGILQIQPEMSFGFAPFILVPALQSLPAFLQPLAHPIIVAWTSSGTLVDSISAVLQIFLGLALLILRSRRFVSLIGALSFVWAIAIWIFGESLGAPGIGMSMLTGFPGAALLYAIASLILIFNFTQKTEMAIFRYTLATVFIISALLQAIPANGYWISGSIASVTGPYAYIYEPHALSAVLYNIAVVLSSRVVPWNMLLTIALLAIGTAWIVKPRVASIASIPVSAIIWFIGQDFGIFGGYGTDPNTGFVLVLMSLAVYLAYRFRISGNQIGLRAKAGQPVPEGPLPEN